MKWVVVTWEYRMKNTVNMGPREDQWPEYQAEGFGFEWGVIGMCDCIQCISKPLLPFKHSQIED